jgi:hypothetical protein
MELGVDMEGFNESESIRKTSAHAGARKAVGGSALVACCRSVISYRSVANRGIIFGISLP